jgi:hypothetical protein
LAAAPPAPVPPLHHESEERARHDDDNGLPSQVAAKRQRGLNGAPTAQPPGASPADTAPAAGDGGATPRNSPDRDEEDEADPSEPPAAADPPGRISGRKLDIWGGGVRR